MSIKHENKKVTIVRCDYCGDSIVEINGYRSLKDMDSCFVLWDAVAKGDKIYCSSCWTFKRKDYDDES